MPTGCTQINPAGKCACNLKMTLENITSLIKTHTDVLATDGVPKATLEACQNKLARIVFNAMIDEKQSVISEALVKKDSIKEPWRLYYIQTFSELEKQKLVIHD